MPNLLFARSVTPLNSDKEKLFHRYPSIDDEIVSEVVGKSHFNLDRVMELVDKRPELSRATWDWSFGDWESALGAASHVGRRDIATYLISKGARPDIFTHAMFGHIEVVKAMVRAMPGIQRTTGPHGISLLSHAEAGLRQKDKLNTAQVQNSEQLIAYLEALGDADPKAEDIPLSEEEKEKFMGDYLYGDGPSDGLSVKKDMRERITLGKLGAFGGGLYQKSPNVFSYNGMASVEIHFELVDGLVKSLTIHEPDFVLKAVKVQD
jgi:hypothetical protein